MVSRTSGYSSLAPAATRGSSPPLWSFGSRSRRLMERSPANGRRVTEGLRGASFWGWFVVWSSEGWCPFVSSSVLGRGGSDDGRTDQAWRFVVRTLPPSLHPTPSPHLVLYLVLTPRPSLLFLHSVSGSLSSFCLSLLRTFFLLLVFGDSFLYPTELGARTRLLSQSSEDLTVPAVRVRLERFK